MSANRWADVVEDEKTLRAFMPREELTELERQLIAEDETCEQRGGASQPGRASQPAPAGTSSTSERGRWSRANDKGKRSKWAGDDDCKVPTHVRLVKSGALIGTMLCTCGVGRAACKRMLTPHDCELAAEACYGQKVLLPPDEGGVCELTNHKAPAKWFALVYSCRKENPIDGAISIDYKTLGGKPLCRSAFRDLYGITHSTFDRIEAKVFAKEHVWRVRKSSSKAGAVPSSLFVAAGQWWIDLFKCFDHTTKHGKLLYEVRNKLAPAPA